MPSLPPDLAWIIVIFLWSMLSLIVARLFEWDKVMIVICGVIALDGLFLLIRLTISFLAWANAWPFVPQ